MLDTVKRVPHTPFQPMCNYLKLEPQCNISIQI